VATRKIDDHTIPDDLCPVGRKAAEALVAAVAKFNGRPPYTGGCRAFYSPQAWAERGERTPPRETVLVVVYDGGDFAPMFNLDYEQYRCFEAGERALRGAGCWAEAHNHWHTYIYRD
jgi:hypothetical protein